MTDRPSNKKRLADISEQLGKVPPSSIETEEVILGAIMLEKDAILSIIDILKPECFYTDKHRIIYEAMVTLFRNHEPIDIKTVVHQVRKMGQLEIVGNAYAITELTSKVNSAAHIEYHARIVYEMHLKREYIRISSQIQHDAYEDTIDVFDLQTTVETEIFRLSQESAKKEPQRLLTLVKESVSEIETKKKNREETGSSGIPSGFKDLDKITGGWQKKKLIIIAGRPGSGKSSLVISSLKHIAIERGIPAALFSLEMGDDEIVFRLISQDTEIPSDAIEHGDVNSDQMISIIEKTGKWADSPLYIDDSSPLTIIELRAKARRLVSDGVKLIAVDYLQLMSGEKSPYKGNREQEIASISRGLKEIAKECDVPVIALSQLSREVEKRPDKTPKLSDLRESGSIESDADMVMFIYRPEYYGIYQDDSGNNLRGLGEVIIAKHRGGRLDNIWLRFRASKTQWLDRFDEDPVGPKSEYRDPTGEKNDFTVMLPKKGEQDDDDGEMPF